MNQRCPFPGLECLTPPRWFRAVVLGVALMPGLARAQESPRDPVGAEDLFRRAMQQLEEGDWTGACERFQKSMDLDPAVSTLAKIAKCREHEGKLAAAWYEYQRALKLALGMEMADWRRRELKTHLQARVAAIEPRVPRLRITVEPIPPGLEVIRDGSPVALSALGEPLPIDPGRHQIVARAPGFVPYEIDVMVEEASSAEAKLLLTAEPRAARVAPMPPSARPRPPPAEPAGRLARASDTRAASPRVPPPTAADSGVLDWSHAGFVLGGVGLATLAAASYFAADAHSLVNDSNTHCGNDARCDQQGVNLRREASDAQTNALLLAGAGILTLGLGTVLVFAHSEPSSNPRKSVPRLEARVGTTFFLARGAW